MKASRFIGIVIISLAVASATKAQDFRERQEHWKTETVRAKGMDTVRIERHSFFALPKISDTLGLVYHEPMPDSTMPKTSIEIGKIMVQASSAEDVLALLEKEARTIGADWVVSFNEPRLKFNANREPYYRSEAVLYKVIDPELVPAGDITEVSCSDCHLSSYALVEKYVQHEAGK